MISVIDSKVMAFVCHSMNVLLVLLLELVWSKYVYYTLGNANV